MKRLVGGIGAEPCIADSCPLPFGRPRRPAGIDWENYDDCDLIYVV